MKWAFVLILLFTLSLFFPTKIFAGSVVLNEALAKPEDNIEWVELYNPTNQLVDLSGWIIKDGNTLTSDDITLDGQIPQYGFRVFEHAKGWLNDTGDETVTLHDGSNTIDSYQYNGATTGKTFGRQPDGGSWVANLSPTKGSSNGAASTFTPSPTLTISPSTTPSPTPQSPTVTPPQTAIVAISAIPSTLEVNKQFNAQVTIQNFSPNTKYFLKGAFKSAGGSNYFGQTLVSDVWVKNYESYNKHFTLTTDGSGSWSGILTSKGDPQDSGFVGEGDYVFKVGYYKEGVSSVAWSNESTIHLVGSVQAPTLAILQTKPKETKPKTEKQTTKVDLPNSILGTKSSQFKVGAVSEAPSPKQNVYTGGFSISYLFIVGGGLIIILSVVLAYTILKRHYGNI